MTFSSFEHAKRAAAEAAERYNLTIFTPTGVHRAGAISVLRMFAQARAEGNLDRAQLILNSVPIEETETKPAISHVIGVGLGRLDEWARQPKAKRIVAAAKPQPWNAAAGKAARRILELAGRGKAFDGLQDLHLRFGGLDVMEGTAVAVAAVVRAFATRNKLTVLDACDALLGGEDDLRLVGVLTTEDHLQLEEFEQWIRDGGADGGEEAEAQAVVEAAYALFSVARMNGLDPHDPRDIPQLLDVISTAFAEAVDEDPDDADAALGLLHETLHDYIHFQLEVGDAPDEWEDAHEWAEDALMGGDHNPLADLFDELSTGPAGDVHERLAAVSQLRIVSAVPDLLKWIGKGRPASPSGTAKRADIQEVAAFLGVHAVGVNSRPAEPADAGEPPLDLVDAPSSPEPHAVMSMNEIPELYAWWSALQLAAVIKVTASRVRPGEQASAWLSDEGASLQSMEMVAGFFLTNFITGDRTSRSAAFTEWDRRASAVLIERLIHAVSQGTHEPPATDEMQLLTRRTDRQLWRLDRLGLLHLGPDGSIDVPVGLRLAILRGVLTASAFLNIDLD